MNRSSTIDRTYSDEHFSKEREEALKIFLRDQEFPDDNGTQSESVLRRFILDLVKEHGRVLKPKKIVQLLFFEALLSGAEMDDVLEWLYDVETLTDLVSSPGYEGVILNEALAAVKAVAELDRIIAARKAAAGKLVGVT